MKPRMSASPGLFKMLREYAEREGLPIDVIPTPGGAVEVERAKRSDECGEDRLLAGGWIGCACAHGIAAKLGIEPLSMGKLLNHLDIKVKQCELGLF